MTIILIISQINWQIKGARNIPINRKANLYPSISLFKPFIKPNTSKISATTTQKIVDTHHQIYEIFILLPHL